MHPEPPVGSLVVDGPHAWLHLDAAPSGWIGCIPCGESDRWCWELIVADHVDGLVVYEQPDLAHPDPTHSLTVEESARLVDERYGRAIEQLARM